MFGIGPQEMAVIALIALIIFGPGKLPEVMREAGAQYKKFKGLADEMTGELNKVTAEARKELDGAFGDLGPEMEKSLGLKSGGKKTSTTASRATTGSTAKKSTTSTTSSAKKATTSKTSSTSKSSSTSTTASKASTATTTTKTSTKPVVASKEDPWADFSSFESETKEAPRRKRSATPSAFADLTPREDETEMVAVPAAKTAPADLSTLDDPLARARARRQSAGYARG